MQGEGWADFGDGLQSHADKVYPELQEEAREQLSLNRYLDMITDPQIEFSVRQGFPRTVEEAVTATLWMESYKIKSFKAAPVHLIDEAATSIGGRTMESTIIEAVSERRQEDPTAELLKTLLERVEHMEASEHEKMPSCPTDQQYWD